MTITKAEAAGIAAGLRDVQAGRVQPLADIRRDLQNQAGKADPATDGIHRSNARAMQNRQQAEKRRQPERAEQAAIVQLLESLGAKVYVLGTTRRKGDYQGSMQTPGIGDLYVFLPLHAAARLVHQRHSMALWVEVKAKRGRPSEDQLLFQDWCLASGVHHVLGGLDAVQNWLVDHGWLRESERRHVDGQRTMEGQ